jgi:hypothetical protein
MHWPQGSDIDRINSHEALIVLRHGSELAAGDLTAEAVDDLLRSALALGVSALDRYVQERVVKQVIVSLRARNRRPA